jgi:hypothetical protein
LANVRVLSEVFCPDDQGYARKMSAQRERDYEDEPNFDDDSMEEDLMDPDRPLESNDQVTVREQLEGESLDTRLAREQREERGGRREDVGRLVEETDHGRDVTKELEADETDDIDNLSAEEAAMHREDEP